jgi:hypothetical protein
MLTIIQTIPRQHCLAALKGGVGVDHRQKRRAISSFAPTVDHTPATSSKPSSSQPAIPRAMIFTGRPSSASRSTARGPVAMGICAIGDEERILWPSGHLGACDLAMRQKNGARNMARGIERGAAHIQKGKIRGLAPGKPRFRLQPACRSHVLAIRPQRICGLCCLHHRRSWATCGGERVAWSGQAFGPTHRVNSA